METQHEKCTHSTEKMTLQTSSEHAGGSSAAIRFAMQNLAAWQQAQCSTSKQQNKTVGSPEGNIIAPVNHLQFK